MNESKNKSAFYHFGVIPNVCIHSLDIDQYSQMYEPGENCKKCGCSEWIESEMQMFKPYKGYIFPTKRVHRCEKCNEVRMAYHIGNKEE